MFPGYSHHISTQRDSHAPELERLAQLDSARPIEAPALVAHVNGDAVAAYSLVDGRSVADPFHHTEGIVTILRLHADGIRAYERRPVLIDRIIVQLRRRGVAPA